MSDSQTSAPATYWRRRTPKHPLPHDHAIRQGEITRMAFQILGREEAIAFLNADNERLGGRPIAAATESAAGYLHVTGELERMHEGQGDAAVI
jgi:uncharacterized protein (DUF2384 family)